MLIFISVLTAAIIYRPLVSFLMGCVFFIQTFSKVLIVTDYYIHQDVYAQTCENKNKPQMHCNGQCHMRKQLQQAEKKEQKAPERKAEGKSEMPFFSADLFAGIYSLNSVEGMLCRFPPLCIGHSIRCAFSIFRPPR